MYDIIYSIKKLYFIFDKYKNRGVAQFGSALGSGPRGRGFKSRHSDHCGLAVGSKKKAVHRVCRLFFLQKASSSASDVEENGTVRNNVTLENLAKPSLRSLQIPSLRRLGTSRREQKKRCSGCAAYFFCKSRLRPHVI